MPIAFDVRLMQSDLSAFAKASSKFLTNSNRLIELQAQLATAVTNAKQGDGKVHWNTGHGDTDQPVRTRPSTSYRSHGMSAKPLVAEISFNLSGMLSDDDENRLIVSGGGTCTKLMWEEESLNCTECHFDIHPNKAGHPTLHTQFVGEVKELPRLISFFAHPLDILEFILMEVFQDGWRRVRAGVKCKTLLHNYPVNQRTRLLSVLRTYTEWLQAEDGIAPLVNLQATPIPPFDLYP